MELIRAALVFLLALVLPPRWFWRRATLVGRERVALHSVIDVTSDANIATISYVSGDLGVERLRLVCTTAAEASTFAREVCAATFAAGSGRRRRLLLVVNPHSGRGSGRRMLSKLQPVLKAADARIEYEVIETCGHMDAARAARAATVERCDGIVVFGGDGTVNEVVNGLLARPDWSTASKIPIGVVAVGTGNGIATSLGLTRCGRGAHAGLLAAIQGHLRSADAMSLWQRDSPSSEALTRRFAAMSVGWAMIAAVDIESERMRWMGKLRNELTMLWMMLRGIDRVRVDGQMFLRKEASISSDLRTKRSQWCSERCTQSASSPCTGGGADVRADTPAVPSFFDGRPALLSNPSAADGFRSIKIDRLSTFTAGTMNRHADDFMPIPLAHMSDGLIDICWGGPKPGWMAALKLLFVFLLVPLGGHVNNKMWDYAKVEQFVLQPGKCRATGRDGIITFDGERLLPYDAVGVEVHRGLLRYFVPGRGW